MFRINVKLMAAIAVLLLVTAPFSWAQRNRRQTQPEPTPTPAAQHQPVSRFFTGDGGRGITLAVLVPEGRGLAANQNYLPTLVQGVIVGDLSKYSAISVLDRQRLETVLRETESGIYRNESDFGRLGEIASVDYALTGSITRTSTGYAMQIQIVGTGSGNIGVTRASYSGTPTIAEMDNFTGIRRASLELLSQLGINLTDVSRQELAAAAATNNVNAQTALAQGITAQRGGTEVAALSYYFQAAAFDSTLLEAANRSSVLNTNISSGNIGSDVRNDIAWRRDWVAKLTEAEQFFDSFSRTQSMPYTLFYSDEITQGAVNYQNETVTLSIKTNLRGFSVWVDSVERALRAVYNGLEATRRKDTWGLGNWPQQRVTNLDPFITRSQNFSIIIELLNSQNEVIGRQTLQSGGSWGFAFQDRNGRIISPIINISADDQKVLQFQNVNANKITDRLTIRVVSVNGIPAENASRDRLLQIRAMTKNEYDHQQNFIFSRGRIGGITSGNEIIIIPDTVWDERVTSIGERAFAFNRMDRRQRNSTSRELTAVTIPNGVVSIGDSAFAGNRLVSVSIPDSVITIGDSAFAGNELASVTIPNGVVSIGDSAFRNNRIRSIILPDIVITIWDSAFAGNQLASVTIPDSVRNISGGAFGGATRITIGANVTVFLPLQRRVEQSAASRDPSPSWETIYNDNGRQAGTYTYEYNRRNGFQWVFKAR